MAIDSDNYEDLESIHYDLNYPTGNPRFEALLVKTIAGLPEEVRGFAVKRCVFITMGDGDLVQTLPGRIGCA